MTAPSRTHPAAERAAITEGKADTNARSILMSDYFFLITNTVAELATRSMFNTFSSASESAVFFAPELLHFSVPPRARSFRRH